MTNHSNARRSSSCPSWCAVRHGLHQGEEDQLHVSAVLQVRQLPVRLCTTIDPVSAGADGPYIMIGSDEYSLYQAETLIDALTQLVDAATESLTA